MTAWCSCVVRYGGPRRCRLPLTGASCWPPPQPHACCCRSHACAVAAVSLGGYRAVQQVLAAAAAPWAAQSLPPLSYEPTVPLLPAGPPPMMKVHSWGWLGKIVGEGGGLGGEERQSCWRDLLLPAQAAFAELFAVAAISRELNFLPSCSPANHAAAYTHCPCPQAISGDKLPDKSQGPLTGVCSRSFYQRTALWLTISRRRPTGRAAQPPALIPCPYTAGMLKDLGYTESQVFKF